MGGEENLKLPAKTEALLPGMQLQADCLKTQTGCHILCKSFCEICKFSELAAALG